MNDIVRENESCCLSSCSPDCSNCSYSECGSDESYYANWENHVNKNGSLFYAEYCSFEQQQQHSITEDDDNDDATTNFKRTSSTRRSKKKSSNKFMKFLTKNYKRKTTKSNDSEKEMHNDSSSLAGTTKSSVAIENYPLQQIHYGDIFEIEVIINPENRYKFGRRTTVTESLLGISVEPFCRDSKKLILAGHMMHSMIIQEKSIKVGDLLIALNNIEVNTENIVDILEQFTEPTKVCLKFQRILTPEQVTKAMNPFKEIRNFEEFVSEAGKLFQAEQKLQDHDTEELVFSLLLLNEDISGPENKSNDVIFCYPTPGINPLYGLRGAFLTLNSIIKTEFKQDTRSTAIKIKNIRYHVFYRSLNKTLILFAISEKYSSFNETKLHLEKFIDYIQFYFPTIGFDLKDSSKTELEHVCYIQTILLKRDHGITHFESLLQGVRMLPLPKEGQLRIYDSLSEMDAMDYREWNDKPLNSHREFFIYGSALYFKSFLLVNQMPILQLNGLDAFLKIHGIFDFIECQNVRDLVIWIEISIEAEQRHFLVITSYNQLLLAVILQAYNPARHISEDGLIQKKVILPSLFYIEEIQETLDHIRYGGIEGLARAWCKANKRPEVITPKIIEESDDEDELGAVAIGCRGLGSTSACKKPKENTTKSRSCGSSIEDIRLYSPVAGSSAAISLTQSENFNKKLDDDYSDSDWDEYVDSHKSSQSGFDMSEMTESLIKEVSDVIPTKITAGKENILVNYISLNIGTGLILCPPEVPTSLLINKFRKACLCIHEDLHKSKKIEQQNFVENNCTAIKEFGIMICEGSPSKEENKFWVIGRLFLSPPREVYVCHRSDIPQNMVELSFRLCFNAAG